MIKSLRARLQAEDDRLLGDIAALVYVRKLELTIPASVALAADIIAGLKQGKLMIGALNESGINVISPTVDTTGRTTQWFEDLVNLADEFFTGPFVKSVNNIVDAKLTRESIVTFRRMV